jgi:molybdopterin-guanine dinucleotide biosynthesis protein A
VENLVALAVLGGGQGRRIGKRKSNLKIGSQTFLEIISERIGHFFSEKYYISKPSEEDFPLPQGFKRLNDLLNSQTPLVGLYTALFSISYPRVLVVACDMPFIQPRLVELLIEHSLRGEVIIPCSSRGPEPLIAIYSKKCLQPVKEALDRGEKRLISFFEKVKVHYLSLEEVRKVDPEEVSFFNINTLEDLKKAQEMAEKNV